MRDNSILSIASILNILLISSCNTPVSCDAETYPEGEYEITGEVISIAYGTDGYTAGIQTEDGCIIHVTISIPNMGPDEEYYDAKEGDTISVFGELWYMGADAQMTVRRITPRRVP